MTTTGHLPTTHLPDLDESDMVKIWVISAFILISGLLTMIAQNPAIVAGYPFLPKLTPHLFYIPIVLMALWYPRRTLQCVVMIVAIFVAVLLYFTFSGVAFDPVTAGFTAAIYLWVVAATSTVARDEPLTYEKCLSFVEKQTRKGQVIRDFIGIPWERLRKSREYIDALVEACHSQDSEIRENAVQTLDLIGEPAVEPLIRALEDDSAVTRETAARALGTIGDVRAIEPLMAALRDDSRRVREAGSRALAAIGTPAVRRLLEGLSDEDWHVRVGSVISLRIIGSPEAILPVIEKLGDRSVYVRREAAKTLGRIGDARAAAPLCRVLDEDVKEVRIRAAWALGRIGDAGSVERLAAAMYSDADADVRLRAAQALALIDSGQARDILGAAAAGEGPARDAVERAFG
ncbi:MAG: HEAT repeat domain-containing protein [Methanomicrobiales archaeon]|nr:HEAT repeat domain-containing protein [Methanomicrobiales archaeon]